MRQLGDRHSPIPTHFGGSFDAGYDGEPGPIAEFNIANDVRAAQRVLAKRPEILLVPVDTAGEVQLSGAAYLSIIDWPTRAAASIQGAYEFWAPRVRESWRPFDPTTESSILFDVLAIALTLESGICEIESTELSIDDQGFTVIDPRGTPVLVALGWRKKIRVPELLIESLGSVP